MSDVAPRLVSVVVPVFNGERHLAAALASAFAQDHPRFEVVLVDDGSTDGSAEVARRFPVRYLGQPNRGVAVARNRGIEESRGEYIAFLDQDDLWEPSVLRLEAAFLDEHPESAFVLARQRFFLDEGVQRPAWLKPELLDAPQAGYLPSALMARRETFEAVGLFDTSYETASDTEWFFKATHLGLTPGWLPDVLVHRRIHDTNQSYWGAKIREELLRVARRAVADRRGRGSGS